MRLHNMKQLMAMRTSHIPFRNLCYFCEVWQYRAINNYQTLLGQVVLANPNLIGHFQILVGHMFRIPKCEHISDSILRACPDIKVHIWEVVLHFDIVFLQILIEQWKIVLLTARKSLHVSIWSRLWVHPIVPIFQRMMEHKNLDQSPVTVLVPS